MLNLVRSTFVIVALGCGAVLFNNDSNRLVLRPIERMLRKVCQLLPSPLILDHPACFRFRAYPSQLLPWCKLTLVFSNACKSEELLPS